MNMTEYSRLKDALKALYELTQAESFMTEDKKTVTIEEIQEIYEERVINVIDLLEHESIYLDKK